MPQVVLLALTIAAVVLGHGTVRPSVAVAGTVAVGLASGVLGPSRAFDATRALDAPIAFLLAAVPLAVLLGRIGFFDAAAERFGGGPRLPLLLWIFAALVTTVFNLDASIVLLTPLYLRIAARHGLDPLTVAYQPVLLASLASSALPVSNLTNLIVANRLDASTFEFARHLGPASLVATVVGWFSYRRSARGRTGALSTASQLPVADGANATHNRRAFRIGLPAVGVLLVGFTLGDSAGLPAWTVAVAVVVVLAALERTVPWRSLPIDAVVVACGLAVLADAAAPHLPLGTILHGTGPLADLRALSSGVVGANAVNNLPALLVGLPRVEHDTTWAFLAGVNFGPVLWITGSLAGLLWMDIVRHAGHDVSPIDYARVGLRVGAPALVLATACVVLTGVVS
jgi:arsenical pump membrane protein